jgi:CRISPR/Cas system-associated exonuclease Cas4 (RecB family)
MPLVVIGFFMGVLVTTAGVAVDRYLFCPHIERTAERAKKERWFKAHATQEALVRDTDTRV